MLIRLRIKQTNKKTHKLTNCRYLGEGTCRFGENCSQAHSEEELTEWKERFERHKKQVQREKQDGAHGNAYAENLLQHWISAEKKDAVVSNWVMLRVGGKSQSCRRRIPLVCCLLQMTENLEGVQVHVSADLSISMSSKKSSHTWMVTVTSRVSPMCIKCIYHSVFWKALGETQSSSSDCS